MSICYSESDTGLYTAKASNGADSSTCSAQLIVRESKHKFNVPLAVKSRIKIEYQENVLLLPFSESEEEKKSLIDQNTPYFAIRLTDTEVMENTYLRFMVKVLGEPRPKIQL